MESFLTQLETRKTPPVDYVFWSYSSGCEKSPLGFHFICWFDRQSLLIYIAVSAPEINLQSKWNKTKKHINKENDVKGDADGQNLKALSRKIKTSAVQFVFVYCSRSHAGLRGKWLPVCQLQFSFHFFLAAISYHLFS